jgi:hypothetical protein
MVNLPRMLLAQQGSDAKVPAEDFRLALTALLQAGSSTALDALSGVVVGSGTGTGIGCDVDSPSASNLRVQPGNFVIQRSTTNGGAYVGTIDAATTVAVTPLPPASQFKAGYLLARAFDEAYGDASDLGTVEIALGAAATTLASVVYPTIPTNSLVLAGFTVTSAGTITLTSSAVRVTTRGGITPVLATDTTPGAFDGQWRDLAGALQRWSQAGASWSRPLTMTWGSGTSLPATPGLGDVYDHTGLKCQLTYTSGGWRQNTIAEAATATARDAISASYAALLHPGFNVWVDSVACTYTWTGSAWGFPNGGPQYFGPSAPSGTIPDNSVWFQTSS